MIIDISEHKKKHTDKDIFKALMEAAKRRKDLEDIQEQLRITANDPNLVIRSGPHFVSNDDNASWVHEFHD